MYRSLIGPHPRESDTTIDGSFNESDSKWKKYARKENRRDVEKSERKEKLLALSGGQRKFSY